MVRKAFAAALASALFGALVAAFVPLATEARGPLSFEERVKAQEAIERVYYNHRIWPKENPQPKPPFEQLITWAQIEAKVTDYLKKSAALGEFWQRPITGEQLQAEMDRMAKGTKDPATLIEVFAALHNDPVLIGECLARPILADRLARSWYANDERFHGETKKKAEAALASTGGGTLSLCQEGTFQKVVYVLRESDERTGLEEGLKEGKNGTEVALDAKAFARELERSPEEGKAAVLRETPEAFLLVRTTLKTSSRLEVETLAFTKEPLEGWLKGQSLAPTLSEGATALESLSLPVVPEAACAGGWNNGVLDDVLEPRVYHTAVWTGSEMIVWGGAYCSYCYYLNTGGRYNPSTDTWMPTSTTNAPSGRYSHTAIWTGTEMIIWGGYGGGSGTDLNTGGRYNPSSDTWVPTSTGANCPSVRYLHTAAWTGTEMIVWGGYGSPPPNYKNDGGRYYPSSDTWMPTSTGTNCPSGRDQHTAVWTGTEMIVWGGLSGFFEDSGGRYNPSSDTWIPTSTGANVPSARYRHTAVWTGSEMIIWGGSNGSYGLYTGGRYNPSSDTWMASVGIGSPWARYDHTAVWTGTEMIVWGGSDNTNYFNNGGRYNPFTDSWTPTSTGANCPIARSNHTAVWTGTEMIIWGGYNGGGAWFSTGGRYNPSSDSWVPTWTPANVPSARYHHTTVWTGTEMIVWGGYPFTNTGGRYSPSTDTWTPTSTGANVPSARYLHTAAWTGTEMVVWGGAIFIAPYYTNTGGRYNPSSDTWVPTSTGANCPSVRYLHTAAWTGTEMIVWGGLQTNTGGRYNPSTDTWVPTSTGTNCPPARYNSNHTAVWTGTEMIVWGGDSNAPPYILNAGGRYNPSTDTWTPTSTGVNVASGRYNHTAVWTGTEMVVWGGVNGSYLNSGGRYNPSTDSWLPTSTGANVPSGREYHAAVWTGTEMIVWGGDNGNYFNTGGRYNPASDAWTPTPVGTGCPIARNNHTAVWTGSEMIVWGGFNGGYLISGGKYNPTLTCSCTADAGSPQTVLVGQPATLNGSASSCTTGSPTAYLWTLVSKPSGSTATITNSTSVTASVTPDIAGTYSISLIVSNANGASAPAYTSVTGSSCAQALSVYPARPSPEPLEAVTFTARGGSGSYTWALTQNLTGATIFPSGSTCRYTAGTAQGTDILHITDVSCGSFLNVTVSVQSLQPQVTEAHFCPPATNGQPSSTLYAVFSAPVTGAQYRESTSTSWLNMVGSGTKWQVTYNVTFSPMVDTPVAFHVRGLNGTQPTAIWPVKLIVSPYRVNSTPILLVHGWTVKDSCTNAATSCPDCALCVSSCGHFNKLQCRLIQDGYDARVVTGIGSWVDASTNATALRNYIIAQGLQNQTLVLVGYSYGGIIIRQFLKKYGEAVDGGYARNVKAVVTIDTPHNGSPFARMIKNHTIDEFGALFGTWKSHNDDQALKWLLPNGTNDLQPDFTIGTFSDIAWYEISSRKLLPGLSISLTNGVLGGEGQQYGHDELVTVKSQQGFGAGISNYHSKLKNGFSFTYYSRRPQLLIWHILHNQILQDDGGTDFDAFYTQTFQPAIQEVLPLTTVPCTPVLMAAAPSPTAPEAQAIPSATQARVVAAQRGTATVGIESTVTATVESTLQTTFGVSLSGGTASVWLTTPSSTVINPSSANGDSIKYDYASDSGMEQHVYTLRAPAAGLWTVHILPTATDPGGLSYTVTTQNLSTLGMNVAAAPGDMLPGDAVVVSATLLKAAAPATGATVAATLRLPDGSSVLLSLYDDGTHQDGAANDGVYANYYTATTQSGPYTVTVNASGTDGSLGAWQRVADTSFDVGRQVGTFTGTYSESAPDANLNGKYDALVITTGVSVTESGDYRVIGDLKDQVGNTCSSAVGTFAASAPGAFNVALSFRGQDIFENSALGPYTLTNLRLYKSGITFSLSDRKNNAYTTTGSYPSWMNFESKDIPLFQFKKPTTDEVVLGNSSTIQWKTGDGYANAVISLYYDSTGTGFAGTAIAGAQRLRKDDPVRSFTWDMTALPEGRYFVYALIQDGSFSDAVYGGSLYKTLDTDGDGMPNSWETAHALDPNNAADSLLDPDADGLNNLQEYLAGTDPRNADTDGGGEKDGSEVLNGRDPLNPADDVTGPRITGVSPGTGVTAGGDAVWIKGVNFQPGVQVTLGGVWAGATRSPDGQTLMVKTPAHASGIVDVVVTNPDASTATLTGGFVYQDAPTIFSLNPAMAPSHGGTNVTVTGTGFCTPERVLFGASEATAVSVIIGTRLTATVPALAAGPTNVTVSNGRYQSATLTSGLIVVDIAPVAVARLDVGRVSASPALSWTPVTLAADGYTIQPTAYSVYRSEILPVLMDPAHRVATLAGTSTSWTDAASGALEFYLVTASYGSAEGP